MSRLFNFIHVLIALTVIGTSVLLVPGEGTMPPKETAEIIPTVVAPVGVSEEAARVPAEPTFVGCYLEQFGEAAPPTESEDFFADFFVSGSDLIYENGINTPYLFINEESYGSIEVDMRDNTPFISARDLKPILKPMLQEDFYGLLFDTQIPYLGPDYFDGFGVEETFDPNAFAVYLTFTAEQISEESVSVSQSRAFLMRPPEIEKTEDLEPASFSAYSNISLYGYLNYDSTPKIHSKMLQLSMFNAMSFCDLVGEFSLSFSPFGLQIGSFRYYYDFPENNIRLSFGSIPLYSALESSGSWGFSLEKSYSYGTGQKMGNRVEEEIIVEKDCTVVVFMNGLEVFRRNMKVGRYRLKDFSFVQGYNTIEIWQVPPGVEVVHDNPDPSIIISYFDMNFDSSLLAKGENLWSFTYGFPNVDDNGAYPGFHYIGLNLERKVAKFSDFSLSWQQSSGLTHTFTMSNLMALSGMLNLDGSYSVKLLDSFNIIKAYRQGRLNLNGEVELTGKAGTPNLNPKFAYSVSISNRFNNPILSPFSMSASYNSTGQRLQLNLGYSKSFFSRLSAGVSGSVAYDFDDTKFEWNVSGSLNLFVRRGFSVTVGVNTSNVLVRQPFPVKISIGASIGLGSHANANLRTDLKKVDAGLSWRPFGSQKTSVQVSASGIGFKDPLDHSLSVSLSYSGKLAGFSVRQQFDNRYKYFSTALNLNTAMVFVDGNLGMTRSVSGSYLLVHPEGFAKKSSISIGKATEASPKKYPKLFGNVLYTGLSPYKRNSIVVFAGDSSMFGMGGSFFFGMTPGPKQGFLKVITVSPSVTISGILKQSSGEPYVMYSSPIYKVVEVTNEEGTSYDLEVTDDYLFTDDSGRFIQSDLESGLYCIDLDVSPLQGGGEKIWEGIFFDVPELATESQVVVLEDYQTGQEGYEEIGIGSDVYVRSVKLKEVQRMDEQSFWDTIFSAGEAFEEFGFEEEPFESEQEPSQTVSP